MPISRRSSSLLSCENADPGCQISQSFKRGSSRCYCEKSQYFSAGNYFRSLIKKKKATPNKKYKCARADTFETRFGDWATSWRPLESMWENAMGPGTSSTKWRGNRSLPQEPVKACGGWRKLAAPPPGWRAEGKSGRSQPRLSSHWMDLSVFLSSSTAGSSGFLCLSFLIYKMGINNWGSLWVVRIWGDSIVDFSTVPADTCKVLIDQVVTQRLQIAWGSRVTWKSLLEGKNLRGNQFLSLNLLGMILLLMWNRQIPRNRGDFTALGCQALRHKADRDWGLAVCILCRATSSRLGVHTRCCLLPVPCVTLVKSFPYPGPRFPHLRSESVESEALQANLGFSFLRLWEFLGRAGDLGQGTRMASEWGQGFLYAGEQTVWG